MPFRKISCSRPGFSLMEMIVAVAIMAVLAMMALPALMSIVPRYELRAAAKSTQTLLQQARLMAAHANRPARVALDCRPHVTSVRNPCQAALDTANFDTTGALVDWSRAEGTARDLPVSLAVTAGAGSTPLAGNPAGLFWAVYFPGGQLKASHDPWVLVFKSEKIKTNTWELQPDLKTGGITLRKGS
ncbi:MAG: prepilin-type N-terminal cleavage/methylation domain-containing protein [Candidatus Adiutrix sp.]|jgi:prepilin-type N-terminal cleavage/methylation domain-containing protein|nr:prepilin-type N-terminal cleavage/methylation domain-containing protein [Candidatus Adiutrix sp.]